MKKFLTIVISLLVVLLLLWAVSNYLPQKQKAIINQTALSLPSPIVHQLNQSTAPKQVVGIPKYFSIPKLQLQNIPIEQVGQDNQGRMDVPKSSDDVGWYNLGFKPGEKGSAVIAGHLDKVTGAPAVFWNISKLAPGDKILINDEYNHSYTFTVTNSQVYSYNQVPLKEVFDSEDKSRLNLITCGGTWNKTTKNYSQRRVVYAELTSVE